MNFRHLAKNMIIPSGIDFGGILWVNNVKFAVKKLKLATWSATQILKLNVVLIQTCKQFVTNSKTVLFVLLFVVLAAFVPALFANLAQETLMHN